MTIHKIRCGMFSWPISIKKYFYRHGISVQKATIELPITSSVLYVCFVLYICCWNCQAHSQLSALLNVISQIRGETASELMLCFHCFHPPTIILFAEGTYRVVDDLGNMKRVYNNWLEIALISQVVKPSKKIENVRGFLAPTGAQGVTMCVCLTVRHNMLKTSLEQSIFIFLGQRAIREHLEH